LFTEDLTDNEGLAHSISILLPYDSRSCDFCEQTGAEHILLPSLQNALQHAAAHHRSAAMTFQCRQCLKRYKNQHAAQCHLLKSPGPPQAVEGNVQCEECERFQTKRGLTNMSNEYQQVCAKDRPYAGAVCHNGLNHQDDIEAHQHKRTGHRPYACDVCNNTSSRKGNMKNHQLAYWPASVNVCNWSDRRRS
jgi:hypothetical protein